MAAEIGVWYQSTETQHNSMGIQYIMTKYTLTADSDKSKYFKHQSEPVSSLTEPSKGRFPVSIQLRQLLDKSSFICRGSRYVPPQ
jgi:hypothetical protein